MTLSSTERWPSSRTMFCCTAEPSRTWPTSLRKTVAPFDEFDRNVVEVVDRRRHRVGADGVLLVADLGRAGRQRQVLRVDRVDDVERREALGQQLGRDR